jgi:hypothetical protein
MRIKIFRTVHTVTSREIACYVSWDAAGGNIQLIVCFPDANAAHGSLFFGRGGCRG